MSTTTISKIQEVRQDWNELPVLGTCPVCAGKGQVVSVSFTLEACPKCWGTSYQGMTGEQALWVINTRKQVELFERNARAIQSKKDKIEKETVMRRQFVLAGELADLEASQTRIRRHIMDQVQTVLQRIGLWDRAQTENWNVLYSLEQVCRIRMAEAQTSLGVVPVKKTRKQASKKVSVAHTNADQTEVVG